MNNDRLKMIKQELRIQGKEYIKVNIVKPAAYFYSEMYSIKEHEGSEERFNRKYITNKAQRSIECYGITGAGLLMEALVMDKKYGADEPWEVIAYTACIDICTLNPVGNLKKKVTEDTWRFKY